MKKKPHDKKIENKVEKEPEIKWKDMGFGAKVSFIAVPLSMLAVGAAVVWAFLQPIVQNNFGKTSGKVIASYRASSRFDGWGTFYVLQTDNGKIDIFISDSGKESDKKKSDKNKKKNKPNKNKRELPEKFVPGDSITLKNSQVSFGNFFLDDFPSVKNPQKAIHSFVLKDSTANSR